MILIDTHVLVWMLAAPERVGPNARSVIDAARSSDALFVSAIVFWEIAMLASKGRLTLPTPTAQLRQRLLDEGVAEITLTGAIGIEAVSLVDLHGDPADRMIVATARLHGTQLVTADRKLLDWSGSISRLDATR